MAFEDFFRVPNFSLQRPGYLPPTRPPVAMPTMKQPLIDPRPGSPFGNVYPQQPAVQPQPASPFIGSAMNTMAARVGGNWKNYGGGLSMVGATKPANAIGANRPVDTSFAKPNAAMMGKTYTNVGKDANMPPIRTLP